MLPCSHANGRPRAAMRVFSGANPLLSARAGRINLPGVLHPCNQERAHNIFRRPLSSCFFGVASSTSLVPSDTVRSTRRCYFKRQLVLQAPRQHRSLNLKLSWSEITPYIDAGDFPRPTYTQVFASTPCGRPELSSLTNGSFSPSSHYTSSTRMTCSLTLP